MANATIEEQSEAVQEFYNVSVSTCLCICMWALYVCVCVYE